MSFLFSRSKSEKWPNHSGFDAGLCYGDIKLGFHFSPMSLSDLERTRIPREPMDPSVVECVTGKQLGIEERVAVVTKKL